MALVIGALLALAVGLIGTGTGLDRDRGFYPVVAIVIASYYALFAVMGASTHALILESLIGAAFLVAAVLGFKLSLWVVVVVLAAHGILDLGHGSVISNPGVPTWWPQFCLTFDVTLAAYLAWLLKGGRVAAAAWPSHGAAGGRLASPATRLQDPGSRGGGPLSRSAGR